MTLTTTMTMMMMNPNHRMMKMMMTTTKSRMKMTMKKWWPTTKTTVVPYSVPKGMGLYHPNEWMLALWSARTKMSLTTTTTMKSPIRIWTKCWNDWRVRMLLTFRTHHHWWRMRGMKRFWVSDVPNMDMKWWCIGTRMMMMTMMSKWIIPRYNSMKLIRIGTMMSMTKQVVRPMSIWNPCPRSIYQHFTAIWNPPPDHHRWYHHRQRT